MVREVAGIIFAVVMLVLVWKLRGFVIGFFIGIFNHSEVLDEEGNMVWNQYVIKYNSFSERYPFLKLGFLDFK